MDGMSRWFVAAAYRMFGRARSSGSSSCSLRRAAGFDDPVDTDPAEWLWVREIGVADVVTRSGFVLGHDTRITSDRRGRDDPGLRCRLPYIDRVSGSHLLRRLANNPREVGQSRDRPPRRRSSPGSPGRSMSLARTLVQRLGVRTHICPWPSSMPSVEPRSAPTLIWAL